MEKKRWITFCYNLPAEPSRYRVSAWRALKKMGVVNIQQSIWAIPYSEENYQALIRISDEIERNNGEALLMDCIFFNEKQEKRIIELMNSLRNEEYREFIGECEKYLKELEKEIRIEKFTFAELEEEEEERDKLVNWLGKIRERDVFHAAEGERAVALKSQIDQAFDQFSEMVYQRSNQS